MAFELNVQDCEQIQKDLSDFLELSEAQATLLCDRGGAILFSEGEFKEEAIDLICALVAGSFAATKELALALGEEEFSAIFHQGKNNSIFISAIGDEAAEGFCVVGWDVSIQKWVVSRHYSDLHLVDEYLWRSVWERGGLSKNYKTWS